MRSWGDRLTLYQDVKDIFNATFRNENDNNFISKSNVERTVKRIKEIGSVKNCSKTGRPLTNEKKALDVLSIIPRESTNFCP